MQVMLVKEEEISDILCRTLPLCCDLQVRLCHFPDVPASNRMGCFAASWESYDFKAIVFLVQGDYQKEVVYPLKKERINQK